MGVFTVYLGHPMGVFTVYMGHPMGVFTVSLFNSKFIDANDTF